MDASSSAEVTGRCGGGGGGDDGGGGDEEIRCRRRRRRRRGDAASVGDEEMRRVVVGGGCLGVAGRPHHVLPCVVSCRVTRSRHKPQRDADASPTVLFSSFLQALELAVVSLHFGLCCSAASWRLVSCFLLILEENVMRKALAIDGCGAVDGSDAIGEVFSFCCIKIQPFFFFVLFYATYASVRTAVLLIK
uniref:Uncharacterized protein n=1 Tax=Oryza barthii TaxID=65489 RepID=A0A0D3GYV6_9ORYZ